MHRKGQHPHSDGAVHRLPDEILKHVFVECASMAPIQGDTWSWVMISYVCSRWRRVALETSDLWRYVDFSHPRWHSITLSRAKTVPLHVNAIVTRENTSQLCRTLQLAHRIDAIHLTSSAENIKPILQLIAHPNPAVESLVVDIQPWQGPPDHDIYRQPLFPTHGPALQRLRYLEMRCAPFYLLTPRCTFVRHLQLHNLPPTQRPELRHFLHMLGQLTRLEHLTLDHSFPIVRPSDAGAAMESVGVSIPTLKTIQLFGSVFEVSTILDSLIVPPTVRLSGTITTLRNLDTHLGRFAQVVSELALAGVAHGASERVVLTGSGSLPRINEQEISQLPAPSIPQTLRIQVFRYGFNDPSLDLSFSPEEKAFGDAFAVTFLSTLWKGLPLSRVHTLTLRDLDVLTQKTWSQILPTIPSLRVLDIVGRPPSGLIWALLMNSRSQARGDGSVDRFFLPKLMDIYLDEVDCSAGGFMVVPVPTGHAPSIHSYVDLDDSRFLDILTAALRTRRRCGLCLRSLSMSRCEYVYKRSVEEARVAVSYLVCDLRNIRKDADVDEVWPARYWGRMALENETGHLKHFYRLRTLLSME